MKRFKLLKPAFAAALILSLLLALAACSGGADNSSDAGGGQPSDSGNNPADNSSDNGETTGGDSEGGESWLLGFNTWGAGVPTFDVMADETVYSIELFGGSGSRVSDENQADKELANIQNFVSADVDGIVMQIAADPVLSQAAEACKAASIPFVLPTFIGLDEDRAEVSASNEYYVGSVTADLYMDGYLMGKAAIEDGCTTALLIGGNIGDVLMEKRIVGFEDAFVKEGGGQILDTARCTSPAECQEKANAMLSAHPEAECIFAMVGDYAAGTIAAQDTLGLSIPIYASNATKDIVPYIADGSIVSATGGNDLAVNIAVALLFNYLDGHPIKDADGNAPEITFDTFLVNADNVEDFSHIFYDAGMHPLIDDVQKSLVWRYNEDVSYDTFVDLIKNGLTLEALLEDHA